MIISDVKAIDCPEHPGAHNALLYCHGHKYAGTWDCPYGYSDAHEHEDLEVETGETMPTGPHDNGHEVQYYVCVGCGIPVEGDPKEDAYDAMVDRQIDEMRGK